jgi:ankyrin repeat protein
MCHLVVLDDVERLFDSDKPHFATWVWLFDLDRPFKGHTSTALSDRTKSDPVILRGTLWISHSLVERLLGMRPEDVNSTGGYFWTPLHASLAKRNNNIALLLLQHGANVNVLDDDDSSSLHGGIK